MPVICNVYLGSIPMLLAACGVSGCHKTNSPAFQLTKALLSTSK